MKMPKLSQSSVERLSTCHSDLRTLFSEVAKVYDFTVTCGNRSEEDQEEAFRTGKTKVHYPNSKHNSFPSQAVDAIPYPVDWKDLNRFYHFAGYVKATADRLGIKLRWGGDWDGDFDFKDQTFNDLPHFELIIDKNENNQGD